MKISGSALEDILRIMGRKGTLVILESLTRGPTRFTTLEKVLKVSPRTLSERLRDLEQQGVIHREAFAEVPPRVEYTLTSKGEALRPLLGGIEQWLSTFEAKGKKNGLTPVASANNLCRFDARG
jgi:DNA-binding HxlR family transcriptional regulator